MRVLVTGAKGFVGSHLVPELKAHKHEVITADLPSTENKADYCCDLTDENAVNDLIASVKPEATIHLGGIAYVPVGWSNPQLMFSVNVTGVINLLEACKKHAPGNRLLVVSSSEIYGHPVSGEEMKEDQPIAPENPYAVSKATADMETLLYFKKYGMPVMTARPANHIGPGQATDFVVPSFAIQLLESALQGEMRVGNLESERDFTDVRDVVRAYRLLVEKGTPGLAYNIASGTTVKISTVLSELCDITGIHPEIKVDPEKYRPAEGHCRINTDLIRKTTGWKPETPLRKSLEDVVGFLKKSRRKA